MSIPVTSRRAKVGALGAFMRKEVRHLLRDRQTLTILLLLPLAQLLLFGFAVRTDINQVRIAIASPTPDALVNDLRTRFAYGRRFQVLPPVHTAADIESLFRQSAVDVGLVFDADVDAGASRDLPRQVQLLVDASDPNTGTTMQNYALAVIRSWQAEHGTTGVRIEPRLRMRFNPTLASANLFVPGLIALILTLVTALMTALSLSREKERGSFEILLVSPLHPWQIILGKVLPYLGLAMINVVSVLIAAWIVFDVPLRGSIALLLSASVLFALVSLSLGVLIAAVTSSQMAATLAALMGTMMPSTMLSGLIFPIDSMPLPLRVISSIVPARWFIDIVRGVMLKGVGFFDVWQQLAVLTLMLAVLLVAAIRRTSVRLA